MSQDRVRVLRVLEYEGPRSWIEKTLKMRAVKGERDFINEGVIKEAIVGEIPTILSEKEDGK